jgi:AraC family transcriptional activator of pobA
LILKDKIPLHSKELQAAGIELRPLLELEKAPTVPHRDDHYMLLLQQKGVSVWEIDFKEWVLQQSALCFVAPGQVHRYVKSKHAEGWLIFMETEMIPVNTRAILDTYMYHHQVVQVDRLHPVFTLSGLLHQLIPDTQQPLRSSILPALSDALTGIFTAAFMPHKQHTAHTGNNKYQLVNTFKTLIKQQFKATKQVKDYAAQLNITPLYLNEITKGMTGFAASYWIQKEILLEAQRLLFYTGMDIREIAFALGYEDYAYFSRFFKKNTGITPSEFRANNHDLSNHNH